MSTSGGAAAGSEGGGCDTARSSDKTLTAPLGHCSGLKPPRAASSSGPGTPHSAACALNRITKATAGGAIRPHASSMKIMWAAEPRLIMLFLHSTSTTYRLCRVSSVRQALRKARWSRWSRPVSALVDCMILGRLAAAVARHRKEAPVEGGRVAHIRRRQRAGGRKPLFGARNPTHCASAFLRRQLRNLDCR